MEMGFDKMSGNDDSGSPEDKAKDLYEQLEEVLEPMGKTVSEFCQEMDKEEASESPEEEKAEEPGEDEASEPSDEDKSKSKALIIAMLKKKKA